MLECITNSMYLHCHHYSKKYHYCLHFIDYEAEAERQNCHLEVTEAVRVGAELDSDHDSIPLLHPLLDNPPKKMSRSQQCMWIWVGLDLILDQGSIIYGFMVKTSPRHSLPFQPCPHTPPTQAHCTGTWKSTIKDSQ